MFAADDLREFVRRVFEQLAMPPADASILADHLVWAELRGVPFLGLRKIPQYAARLRHGGTRAVGDAVVIEDRPSFLVMDGCDTWGHVAGARAMELAIEKARATGVGVAVVRNTTSAGALGYYAMLAAERRMIGLAINNAPPLQPPWGGTTKALGNQAFAIGSPAGRHQPLLLDMATSAMSWARMHEYERRGEALPDGVALTAAGEPTTDPAAAVAGMLMPMSGHRGYSLALMWEVLTGVLAGGERFASDVTMPDVYARPQGVSLYLQAIDPTMVMRYDEFVARVDDLIDRMHASPPRPGFERVAVPGERGHATSAARRRDGMPLPHDLVKSLQEIGTELGVGWIGTDPA